VKAGTFADRRVEIGPAQVIAWIAGGRFGQSFSAVRSPEVGEIGSAGGCSIPLPSRVGRRGTGENRQRLGRVPDSAVGYDSRSHLAERLLWFGRLSQ
jgi:hypothetical protein